MGKHIERVFKKNSLKPNSATHNNASWCTDADGFLEHSPSWGSLYYKGPVVQKITPGFFLGGVSLLVSWMQSCWSAFPHTCLDVLYFLMLSSVIFMKYQDDWSLMFKILLLDVCLLDLFFDLCISYDLIVLASWFFILTINILWVGQIYYVWWDKPRFVRLWGKGTKVQ